MKKVAVLLDGGYVSKKLIYSFPQDHTINAIDIVKFAISCVNWGEEELFRIYYYDCPPFDEIRTHPVTGKQINYKTSTVFNAKELLQRQLQKMDHVAFRKGRLSFDGWKASRGCINKIKELCKNGTSTIDIDGNDLVPDFKQKRVDIKIGLDIAWLSSKNIVDRIVLVAGDSDFIPAMKFARREGVQVVLVPMNKPKLKEELYSHADQVRVVDEPYNKLLENWNPGEPNPIPQAEMMSLINRLKMIDVE